MSCKWVCGAPPARPPPPATVKAAITQLHASIVSITGIGSGSEFNSNLGMRAFGDGSCMCLRGIGVLIHPTLVLTTHSTIPSPASIKDADISFCLDISSLSYVKRKFVPEIFFQTDAQLDLTVISCEIAPEVETLALDTTRLSQRALRKGCPIFVMGCQVKKPEDVVILEGGVVGVHKAGGLPTHVLFQTGDGLWMPGSAGFDKFGTFSFIVTSPPKLQERVKGDKESGVMGGFFSSKYPKQHATSIQVVREWVEPLWRINRDEVFQGPELALGEATSTLVDNGFKRPSLQETSVQKEESIAPRSSVAPNTTIVSMPIWQATSQCVQNVEKLPTYSEPIPMPPPQKPPEQIKPTTKSVGVETLHEDPGSDYEKKSPKNAKAAQRRARKQSPDGGVAVARERRAKREDFVTLKKNKGLKTLMDKGTKTSKPAMDSVSVQTELFLTEADVKPMIIVSRPGSPEAGEGEEGRRGHRERWSLPADGHGLDFLRGEDELPPSPMVIRRSRASMSASPTTNYGSRSNKTKEAEGVPSWMDKYYARGRSLSEASSHASSAGTTPPRPRRQVVSDHADHVFDVDDTASLSGSSSRSLQRAESAYFKPTISYMQKRNPSQRDNILARQASQTALPRWS